MNMACDIFAVLSPYAFSICDTTNAQFGHFDNGGIVTQVKVPTLISFVSIYVY